ncbi:uncharacterized protein [Watersipora subatra]|uniref:uncharacterized protein n=1 Tax=Watersipora subatra TaxID=2589382 RepID=UPI00355C350D
MECTTQANNYSLASEHQASTRVVRDLQSSDTEATTAVEQEASTRTELFLSKNILSAPSRTVEERKQDKRKTLSKMKTCRFFFSERGCAYGDACNFSHEIDLLPSNISRDTTDSDSKVTPRNISDNKNCSRPPCKFFAAGFCKWGSRCGFAHSRVHQHRPTSTKVTKSEKNEKKLSEMTDQDLNSLRRTEISQLKKRFPKRIDVDTSTFRFVFRVSDPDWPFDVKSINLELTFPSLYPKHMMTVRIFNEECLPSVLARHICKKMDDWLTDKQEANQKHDTVELVFRPFLRWLDKTAEQIFTDGLSMYKRELAAKAAGFKFVSNSNTRPSEPVAKPAAVAEFDPVTDPSQSAVELEDNFSSAVQLSDNSEESETEADCNAYPTPADPSVLSKLNPAKRGTELRLKNLQLLESTASLHCTILRTGIRCTRCKTAHHITMHPEKPYVVVCDKCKSKMSLIYHPNLMHVASSTVGFFDLDACQPFDLILQDCQLIAACLGCDRELPIHGLHADQLKQFWCTGCHKKMGISVEKGSFIVLNDGAAIKIGANAVLIAKKAKAMSDLKILGEGKQLPDKGACLHYKKSFRWFRFPCCGKLYPCDKCHDEKETDHEMELANRMVCGFCSKEQGFSLTKPCISCDLSLTRSKSQHWEGGQGCRNRVAMAKGDKQKFAGSNKTVSKKAESLQKKSGKKTTHLRHAV